MKRKEGNKKGGAALDYIQSLRFGASIELNVQGGGGEEGERTKGKGNS